jgi:hypothetical protein
MSGSATGSSNILGTQLSANNIQYLVLRAAFFVDVICFSSSVCAQSFSSNEFSYSNDPSSGQAVMKQTIHSINLAESIENSPSKRRKKCKLNNFKQKLSLSTSFHPSS